jgi:hypothetical protein
LIGFDHGTLAQFQSTEPRAHSHPDLLSSKEESQEKEPLKDKILEPAEEGLRGLTACFTRVWERSTEKNSADKVK